MYKFKKNCWHVRFYQWLFNVNPTNIYKSMCPYFWTYALIFFFIIPILILKLLGNKGSQLLNWIEKRKREKRDRLIEAFVKKCENPNLTNKEAYEIKKSKCWDRFYYYIEYKHIEKIRLLSSEYANFLFTENNKKEKAKKEKIKKIKENKTLIYLFNFIGGCIILFILSLFVYFLSLINWSGIDWMYLLKGFGIGVLILIACFLIFFIIKYLVISVIYVKEKISCLNIKCPLCSIFPSIFNYIGKGISNSFPYICVPFIFIGKGILVCLDMIYNTYKKRCPLIKWED